MSTSLRKIMKNWFKRIWLFPLFVILGVPEEGGGEGGEGGSGGEGGGSTLLTGDEGASGGSSTGEESSLGEGGGGKQGSEGEDEGGSGGDEGKDGEKGKNGDGDKKDEGAPEEYADFTLPEGIVSDPELLAEFKPIAKELNLTQEQAQKLVDIQSKAMLKMHTDRIEQWNETQKGWVEAAKTDKEIGGDKFKENIAVAQRALNTFGTDELKKALNDYGLGSHPELVRMMYRIGSAMSEDSLVLGGKGDGKERDTSIEGRASRLYGSK